MFTILAQPDEQSKSVGVAKEEITVDRHHKRLNFWSSLLAKSRAKTNLFSAVSPQRDHWISSGSGRTGVVFQYLILQNGAEIDLNIASDNKERNKAIFDRLKDQQSEIEKEMETALDWRRMDESLSSRIVLPISVNGGLNTPDKWPGLQDEMIAAMIRFDAAIRPRLARIQI